MRVRGRIERAERQARAVGRTGGAPGPLVEIWLPDNGRGDQPPGRYPLPGSNAVVVIYGPDEEPPCGGSQA